MGRKNILTLILALCVTLSGCASESARREKLLTFENTPPGGEFGPRPEPVAEFNEPPLEPAELRPGFLIRLRGLDDKALNGTFRVDWNGRLDLPFGVLLQVVKPGPPAKGITLDELRRELAKAYEPYYKNGARIEVSLAERTYLIEVRGLVQKPGRLSVKKDTNLDEVISMAGGLSSLAGERPGFVKFTRDSHAEVIDLAAYYNTGSPTHLTEWRGGETLFFQKESFIQPDASVSGEPPGKIRVLGEVRNPGPQTFRPGSDIFYYLSEAGGPTKDSDLDKIQVIRGEPGHEKAVEFALNEIQEMPPLKRGDIVIFHADKTSVFQKTLTIAGSIATVLGTVALLIIAL